MKLGFGGWVAGCALALGLFARAFVDLPPYDDSHFFERVAINGVEWGMLAWNLDEGPVFGSTSQAFQLLAVAVAAVTRHHFVLATRGIAALTLLGTFAVLHRQTAPRDGGLAAAFALTTPVVLATALSGMETALCLLALSVLLATLDDDRLAWWASPATAVGVALVRPDAALLAVPVLLAVRWRETRRMPWREVLLLVLSFAALLALFRWYYGTALPLPFYAKQAAFSPYDAHFRAVSRTFGLARFGIFAVCAAPLVALALLRRDARNAALLGSALLFVGYHLASTIDVMGMHGRFYVVALPLLVVAAARGAEASVPDPLRATLLGIGVLAVFAVFWVGGWLPKGDRLVGDGVPAATWPWVVGAGLVTAAGALWPRARAWVAGSLLAGVAALSVAAIRPAGPLDDDGYLERQTAAMTVFRGIDTLRSCFGGSIHLYHSEVGLPGVRFQRGKVTDLAGLVSEDWMFRRITFEEACAADRPEAIFLPHKNYRDLNAEILQSQCLTGYVRMTKSSSPLYVRRDLAPRFRKCASEAGDPE